MNTLDLINENVNAMSRSSKTTTHPHSTARNQMLTSEISQPPAFPVVKTCARVNLSMRCVPSSKIWEGLQLLNQLRSQALDLPLLVLKMGLCHAL